jgi:hypothetical protein
MLWKDKQTIGSITTHVLVLENPEEEKVAFKETESCRCDGSESQDSHLNQTTSSLAASGRGYTSVSPAETCQMVT